MLNPALSLPSWERGLKWIWYRDNRRNKTVAPLVGAWIEITFTEINATLFSVAPLVGAWIEITPAMLTDDDLQSLPSWERGLK